MSVTPTITPTITPTPTICNDGSTIICGSGVTTGNFYYTDCCGNFVQGTGAGLAITLNYTKPFNGVVKLNVPYSTVCPTPSPTQTPSYTPTNTSTPTVTPSVTTTSTLTPTPSSTPPIIGAYALKNDCEVFTLFDMGVKCFPVVQPNSSISNDGILSLKITGGTSPYSIYWEGGQRTQTLVGVPAGSYEVVVVDYYGDYTAQTICSLFAPSATPTPSITASPTLTPSPVWPNLCLTVIYPNITYGPFTFVPNGNRNGKPSWIYSTYNVVWNTSNNRWEIQGWDKLTGIPVSTNSTFIPTSAWSIAGGPQATITMTQGDCGSYAPLQASLEITKSTCNGTQNCNGSISVTTSYGQSPYTYSINNGVTYQSSNIFNGLCPNTYTILVKDSAGSTLSKIATLGYDEAPVTYTIGVTLDNIITVDSSQQIANWRVNVTPALPVGTSITFNLNMSDIKQYNAPGTGLIQGTTSVYKNGTSIPRSSTNTTSQTTARPNCSPYQTITTTTTDVYPITIGNSDVVSGTSTSILTITDAQVGSNGCATTLVQDILISTASPVKNGCSCCEVVNNSNSVGIVKHTLVNGSISTPAPPVLTSYIVTEVEGADAGCYTGDFYTDFTITLLDQYGNPINATSNTNFIITYNYDDVQDVGGGNFPDSTINLAVTTGNSSATQRFYTKQYVYCNYSSLCNGTCYNESTGMYVSYSPI
jgi:hypothetical protein